MTWNSKDFKSWKMVNVLVQSIPATKHNATDRCMSFVKSTTSNPTCDPRELLFFVFGRFYASDMGPGGWGKVNKDSSKTIWHGEIAIRKRMDKTANQHKQQTNLKIVIVEESPRS